MVEPDGLRERLRAGLRDSMKLRDKTAMAAFRAALSAIDNADAAQLDAEIATLRPFLGTD